MAKKYFRPMASMMDGKPATSRNDTKGGSILQVRDSEVEYDDKNLVIKGGLSINTDISQIPACLRPRNHRGTSDHNELYFIVKSLVQKPLKIQRAGDTHCLIETIKKITLREFNELIEGTRNEWQIEG